MDERTKMFGVSDDTFRIYFIVYISLNCMLELPTCMTKLCKFDCCGSAHVAVECDVLLTTMQCLALTKLASHQGMPYVGI